MSQDITVDVASTTDQATYTATAGGQSATGTGNGGDITIGIGGVPEGPQYLSVSGDNLARGKDISVTSANTRFSVSMRA